MAYDQFPAPNDDTYGVNAVGWGSRGHTFGDLTGSDKAGFMILKPNGTPALQGTTAVSFNIDAISSTTVSAAAPSGYASLGPFGGDGSIVVNSSPVALTNDPAKIVWGMSMERNLNRTGYFVGGVQTVGKPSTAGCDAASAAAGTCSSLIVDSPKTLNTTDSYTLKGPNPWNGSYQNTEYLNMNLDPQQQASVVTNVNGWNFHNTFFVTLKQAYLQSLGFDFSNWAFSTYADRLANCAGKWCVVPNDTTLHNSPAKACPVDTSQPKLSVTKWEVKSNQIKITILNGSTTADEIINNLKLNWPQATNGNLTTIKLDGDVMWTGSQGGGTLGAGGFGVPPLTATASKRTVGKNSSDVLLFQFANNVAPLNNASYSGSATFVSGTTLDLGLPRP
jgi:hypothetical protein